MAVVGGRGVRTENRECNVEYIAKDYLENLIDLHLVQAEKFGVDGSVKTYRIHNLLRELRITEAVKEIFLESRSEVSPSTISTGNPHRLSVQSLGQGTATLGRMGAFAGMTRLGLSDSSSEADWNLLADLNKMQNLESLKIASQINDSTILLKMDSNWFPTSLIKGDSFARLQVLSMDEVTVQSLELKEGASPGLEHLLFDKCNFDGDLPYNALAALDTGKGAYGTMPA
ncbi:hypothetical protein Ancab_028186 [Ancistrocladus abbreviatus]